MPIINKIRNYKNSLIAKKLQDELNHRFGKYGIVENITINSKQSNIMLEILLKGENNTTTIELFGYNIIKIEECYYFEFRSIKFQKEWVGLVFNDFVLPLLAPESRYPVKSEIAKIIKLLI